MSISSGDLARMRATALALLPDTCTIQTATRTTDSLGGTTSAWANTSTNVKCRLSRFSEQNVRSLMVAERPTVEADWIVTLPHDQALVLGQRIVVGGLTLDPVWVNTGRSWETATRAFCREVS